MSEPIAQNKSQANTGMWIVAVFILGAVALIVMYQAGLLDQYLAMQEAFHETVAAWFPASMQSLVLKGAEVFLTPWLYLVMLIVFVAERLSPANPEQKFFSVGMIYDFTCWFLLNSMLRIIIIGAMIVALRSFYNHYLSSLTIISSENWNPFLAVTMGVIVADFLNWFHHLLRHKLPFLWAFHAIHHSQREMNMFTDLRVHLVEYIIAKPIVLIPLFIMGLEDKSAIWVIIIFEAYSRIYHANIRSNYGPLRYIFVTPQSHRVHHSCQREHYDRNFGVILCVWDRLFGTHWDGHDEYPVTGVPDKGFPFEQTTEPFNPIMLYLRQSLYPFQAIWNAIRGNGWELNGPTTRQKTPVPVRPPVSETDPK